MPRVEKLLLRPHLHVYLHCPAKIALERIRHREANDVGIFLRSFFIELS